MTSMTAKKVEPKEATGHVWVAVYAGPEPGRRAHLGTLVCKDDEEAEELIKRLDDSRQNDVEYLTMRLARARRLSDLKQEAIDDGGLYAEPQS